MSKGMKDHDILTLTFSCIIQAVVKMHFPLICSLNASRRAIKKKHSLKMWCILCTGERKKKPFLQKLGLSEWICFLWNHSLCLLALFNKTILDLATIIKEHQTSLYAIKNRCSQCTNGPSLWKRRLISQLVTESAGMIPCSNAKSSDWQFL